MKTRAKTQVSVDVWVAISGTAGSLLSGIIVANSSYDVLGFVEYLSLLLIPLMVCVHFKGRSKEVVKLS